LALKINALKWQNEFYGCEINFRMSKPRPNSIPIIMEMAPAIEAFNQTAK
jgi:hypothetical protein